MAADGAWPRGSEPAEAGDARTDCAVARLRTVLDGLEGRLGGSATEPLSAEVLTALVGSLEALTHRMAALETGVAGRSADLTARLRRLTERLDDQAAAQVRLESQAAETQARIAARLELAMDELAAVRAGQAIQGDALRADPGPIRALVAVAGAAAALSVVGAGVLVVSRPQALPPVLARPLEALSRPQLRPGLRFAPLAATLATAPTPTTPVAVTRDSYESVATALERGEATALPRLTGLAQAGDLRAQLHLASLYEGGAAGLGRDMAAARLWTRRAAEGGDRLGMHNLALYLMNAEGGPRDVSEAVVWFRRAAERGVVDSQYNLGLLYEAGRGVEKNLREAYRWFTVAANAGDVAAREKQVELEGRLRPAERAGLDRDAQAFQPGAAEAEDLAVVIPPATTLAETQALLARQGYYVGPVDGVTSPALRMASAAYLRDHPGVTMSASDP